MPLAETCSRGSETQPDQTVSLGSLSKSAASTGPRCAALRYRPQLYSRTDPGPVIKVRSGFQGKFLIMPVQVTGEDQGELVSRPAGLQRCSGIDPASMPGTVAPGGDEQRREGGIGQRGVASRDQYRCRIVSVFGDLRRDDLTGLQAGRDDRRRRDDLTRAQGPVKVLRLRVLPGRAEDQLQRLSAPGCILPC